MCTSSVEQNVCCCYAVRDNTFDTDRLNGVNWVMFAKQHDNGSIPPIYPV